MKPFFDAIPLPGYLEDAYLTAEEFCKALGERMRSAGFMRTLLLRRIGSSIEAGKNTALKILGGNLQEALEEEEEEENEVQETEVPALKKSGSNLTESLTANEQG
ncbi:MAG: helicase SNF2, partial [Bacteroidota bacterium]